jgi:hypothetical protein
MSDQTVKAPISAWVLGLAGLGPAMLFTAVALFADTPLWPHAWRFMLCYGAVILSFIGGAWWGLASAPGASGGRASLYVLAIAPALVAAVSLIIGDWRGLSAVSAAFFAALAVDTHLVASGVAPKWWTRLRLPLSAMMGLLHAAVAWTWATRTGGM